jgi:hypothetical protein
MIEDSAVGFLVSLTALVFDAHPINMGSKITKKEDSTLNFNGFLI